MKAPFIKADEARYQSERRTKEVAELAFKRCLERLNNSVLEAVDKGCRKASIEVPTSLMEGTIVNICRGLKKLGYKVSLKQVDGFLGENLYYSPKNIITVYW